MPQTNYGSGLTSFGVPVFGLTGLPLTVNGSAWFVDGNLGSDTASGQNRSEPFATMSKAFDEVSSGDVIFFKGNIREQLSAPAGIFGVTIIGDGEPRHADAHTSNNGYYAPTWKVPASPTAATPLLILRQQGWRLFNILFDGPADAAAVQLFRDGGAGDAERDASHAHIAGCKFVAAQNHIEFKGGLSQVIIESNLFFGATADSLLETVGAGIGTNNFFRIINNHFHSNATHIDVALNYATIQGNVFGNASGDKVDLRGGSENMLFMNTFYGTYSNVGGYYAGTNDEWGANGNSTAGGWTAADPA